MGSHSKRYGDLSTIAAKTGGRCHICGEPADVRLYGRTGEYGPETVTVDHLTPQSEGGDDSADNLMIAHGGCNSFRGTAPAELARLIRRGTASPPMSTSGRLGTAAIVGAAAYATAGSVFSRQGASGRREFNGEAAFWLGLAAGALTYAAC